MALIQITAPATEPVTLAEIKQHLRIPDSTSGGSTAEDSYLYMLGKVARKQAENLIKRQCIHATWQLVLGKFPDKIIELPRPPLSTVSTDISITYVDSSGATQTVPTTAYTIDRTAVPPRIFPSTAVEWSDYEVSTERPNPVTVQYVSGYSSVASTAIPDNLKLWILMKTAQLYEYREPVSNDQFREVPRDHFNGLLDDLCVITLST